MDYLERGYRIGSIIRVHMHNFLSYDDCEVFPGPKLNVVIGPNGTGKSALTHAICLACAGTTGDIGRANDLSMFVKKGKEGEESFVEIDILISEHKITNIKRVISSNSNSSKWFYDKKPSSLQSIKELMASLSIDVDNLCSFMPQDKVGKFTQYNSKEVLQNTLKSINSNFEDKNLYEEQINLSDSQKSKDSLRKIKEAKEISYQETIKQLESLTVELNRLEKREQAKECQKLCQIKLLKLEADSLRGEIISLESYLEEKNGLIHNLKETMAPIDSEVREIKRTITNRENASNQIKNSENPCSMKIERNIIKIKENDLEIETHSQQIEHIQTTRNRNETNLQKLTVDITNNKRALAESEAEIPTIRSNISLLNTKMNDLVEAQSNIRQEIDHLQSRLLGEHNEKLSDLTRERNSLIDSNEIFKNNLRISRDRSARDCYQALEWLNSHNNVFSDHIYGPIGMLCNTKDQACAAMLEKSIPTNKLLGFIATNDEDAKILKNELRGRLRLQVDIFTMKNADLSNFRCPYDNIQLNSFRQFGIKGYLSDQLSCPDVVRAFLFAFQGLHTILWGKNIGTITSSQLNLLCSHGINSFRLYMHDERNGDILEHSGRKSRYAPNAPPSIASNSVTPKGLIQSSGQNDTEARKNEIDQKISTLRNKVAAVENEINVKKEEGNRLNLQLASYRNDKTGLNQKLQIPETLRRKILRLEEQASELTNQLSRDIKEEKKAAQGKIFQLMNSILNSTNAIQKDCQQLSQIRSSKTFFYNSLATLKNQVEGKEKILRENQHQMDSIKQELQAINNQIKMVNFQIQKKDKDLEKIAQDFGGLDVFVSEVFPRALEYCKSDDKAEIEAHINSLQNEIDEVADNPLLLQRKAHLDEQAHKLKGELEEAIESYENAENSLVKRIESWVTSVQTIANKLNIAFSENMKGLGFYGEIKLLETGNILDYELQLFVAFRKDAELVKLSGSRHSGGERAVSTIMFLLALQDMTSSPFRVVDEINQGMDERNERLVFERIVQSCCGDKTKPQYFLVSPKLLQALNSLNTPELTVLLVWNGPGIRSKWDLTTILHGLRQTYGVTPPSSSSSNNTKHTLTTTSTSSPEKKRKLTR